MDTKKIYRVVTILGLVAVTAFIVDGGVGVRAASQVTEVYPTGVYPDDVYAVQAAIDQGGEVLLKATNASGAPAEFDFGNEFAGVDPPVDVDIVGEWAGSHQTTIRGGYWPIWVGAWWVPSPQTLNISIRNIHFEEPKSAAVMVTAAEDVEIADNVMTNIIGGPYGETYKGQGIWVACYYSPFDFGGKLIISRNRIENVNAPLGHGIALFSFGAETRIDRNTIRGMNSNGILAFYAAKTVKISNNVVEPGPERYPGINSAGNGISMATFLEGGPFDLGGPEYIEGNFIAENNIVTCENPMADGITLAGDVSGGVITTNQVTMNDSYWSGISVFDGVSDFYIGQNHVKGNAFAALTIYMSYFREGKKTVSNTFQGNNIATFEAGFADVYLSEDSQNTVVAGYSGTVLDFGEENKVTGFTKPKGGIGQQISEAHARKRTAMNQMLRALSDIPTSREGSTPKGAPPVNPKLRLSKTWAEIKSR